MYITYYIKLDYSVTFCKAQSLSHSHDVALGVTLLRTICFLDPWHCVVAR